MSKSYAVPQFLRSFTKSLQVFVSDGKDCTAWKYSRQASGLGVQDNRI
ncbi:MAG TPA: hypothetical protein V6D18_09020 [Thermosynechococcaceae cyanobacterium]